LTETAAQEVVVVVDVINQLFNVDAVADAVAEVAAAVVPLKKQPKRLRKPLRR